MTKELGELAYISTKIGEKPEYVQGGGGNTSVKIDEYVMAVKASGYKLSDVTITDAVAFVNYTEIKRFFRQAEASTETAFNDFIRSVKIEKEGYKDLRPSIEAGFHALLRKYVIHTHSVYSNILNCCKQQRELVKEIFRGYNNILIVDYASPGLELTISIYSTLEEFYTANNYYPEIIFLKNHGIIVNADTSEKALALHEEVTNTIREYFNLVDCYPTIRIEEINGRYLGKSDFKKIDQKITIKEIIEAISKNIIFPDQIVYFNADEIQGVSTKFTLQEIKDDLYYLTNYNEALTIEETIMAYAYIYYYVEKNNLKINNLSNQQVHYIMNMESEKYRKQLLVKEISIG